MERRSQWGKELRGRCRVSRGSVPGESNWESKGEEAKNIGRAWGMLHGLVQRV